MSKDMNLLAEFYRTKPNRKVKRIVEQANKIQNLIVLLAVMDVLDVLANHEISWENILICSIRLENQKISRENR